MSKTEEMRKWIQYVQDWLWAARDRETSGQPWPDEYVRDAARMCRDAKQPATTEKDES